LASKLKGTSGDLTEEAAIAMPAIMNKMGVMFAFL
jgi:hypothetical protein